MNPLLRGATWGVGALALGGIATMAVAPNDSPAVPATHPSAGISTSYDCPHQILRYDVTGDGWEKFTVDIPGVPSWKETLYSAGNLQFKLKVPGIYWFDHILTVHGEDFHGKRKVVVPEGCSTTTTSTTPQSTTNPSTSTNPPSSTTNPTTTSTSTTTTSVPETSSSVPSTTSTSAPSVVTSSPSRVQPSTSVPFTIPATK